MAYQQNYYDYPGDLGYQEGMEETELMYYQDQYDQYYQFQQSQLPSHQQSVMHRYSTTSCEFGQPICLICGVGNGSRDASGPPVVKNWRPAPPPP